jgi:hypothetical protein
MDDVPDARLFDGAGVPLPARIELAESSGPVSPRHQYTTKIVVEASGAVARLVRDHRDASGAHHDERPLDRTAYEALFTEVLAALPLGQSRDLVGAKRDRKGVSFNHVLVVVGGLSARLDYLQSDVDEDGDTRARAVVEALKRAAR